MHTSVCSCLLRCHTYTVVANADHPSVVDCPRSVQSGRRVKKGVRLPDRPTLGPVQSMRIVPVDPTRSSAVFGRHRTHVGSTTRASAGSGLYSTS